MAVITTHHVAEQVTRASKLHPWSVPKSPTMKIFDYLIGPKSILTKDGEEWKQFRRRFNPGFAPKHIMTLLPCIIDKTWLFVQQLDSYAATGEPFSLVEMAINVTFDIIGSVVMDVDFDAQHLNDSRKGHFIQLYTELARSYSQSDNQVPWWLTPGKIWRRKRLSDRIDKTLRVTIQEKFAERDGNEVKSKSRSILNLSLQDTDILSDEVLSVTVDQIKTFLFAGHDTTSTMLSWMFYEMSRTPRVGRAVREELDEIFGPDPDPAVVRGKLLSPGGDEMLSRMSYTSAVIKETLRLYPPAGSARYSPAGAGFTVTDESGQVVDADEVMLYVCHVIVQRDKAVYGETAEQFVPERWLGNSDTTGDGTNVDLGDAGDLEKNDGRRFPASAWRPFERGPRNCIGQELANIEARVIVAMIARRYDFTKVGRGELVRDEKGGVVMNETGQCEVQSELYNVRQVTSKPVDGMRMTVRLSEKATALGGL